MLRLLPLCEPRELAITPCLRWIRRPLGESYEASPMQGTALLQFVLPIE